MKSVKAILRRAEELCDEFYELFPIVYSEGSCAPWSKLPQCWVSSCEIVREWGPLYSWSTFGFEDINGQLMKMIHGTGDITLQLFHMKETHNTVSSLDFRHLPAGSCSEYIKSMSDKLCPWKILATAKNCCKVIGPSRGLTNQYPEEIKGMISTATDNSIEKDLKIVQRIMIKSCQRLHSDEKENLLHCTAE